LGRNPGTPAALTINLRETVEKRLLEQSPTCIVVNERGDVVFIHGRTGKYLEVPPGTGVSTNAFSMAREGLQIPLSYAVHKTLAQKERVVYENVLVRTNGAMQTIRLVTSPLPEPASGTTLVLVEFHEMEAGDAHAAAQPAATPAGSAVDDKDIHIAELEHELQAMREYLQSTNEELEASNEELKSTNEELQSANEELETSREELLSVNEELVTLNAEYETKIEQLTRTKNDLENTLTQVDIAIIFLDRKLWVRQFNPAATRISNLIAADIGRPLSHIVSKLKHSHIIKDAQEVFDTLVPKEAEIQADDDRWYVMRIRPYRTVENVIDGVTMTFSEITEQKRVEAEREKLMKLLKLGNGEDGRRKTEDVK
jgi:two-component system, chemotaxis family, CheB/CheR fusion protein